MRNQEKVEKEVEVEVEAEIVALGHPNDNYEGYVAAADVAIGSVSSSSNSSSSSSSNNSNNNNNTNATSLALDRASEFTNYQSSFLSFAQKRASVLTKLSTSSVLAQY